MPHNQRLSFVLHMHIMHIAADL